MVDRKAIADLAAERKKRRTTRRTSGSEGGGDDDRPVVRIVLGEISRAIDEIELALKARPGPLFQRAGEIVHVVVMPVRAADGRQTSSHRIVRADDALVGETITNAMRLEKYDARRQDYAPMHCPRIVVDTVRGRKRFGWLRDLRRVINAPILRSDYSVLADRGYDAASGLFLDSGDCEFPVIPAHPSRADALDAVAFLKKPLRGFSFVGRIDMSVALAAILTAIVRPSLPSAPMIGATAPTSGSGKSLLFDGVAMIATGRVAPVIAQGETGAETEKRIAASLIAGDAIISIDNAEYPIGGALLCQALTQSVVKVRFLGQSVNIDVPAAATFFCTGNNLRLLGDVTRRVLLCSLDPQCERPELRRFDFDFLEELRKHREKYVAAALTIMRARAAAGWSPDLPPLGSFDAWCRMVRDALIWVGESDPCETIEKVRGGDPRLSALASVMDQWEAALGDGKRISVSKIIDLTGERNGSGDAIWADFRDALMGVAGNAAGTAINARRLGNWLSFVEGRIVLGRRFVRDGTHAGVMLWKLDFVERDP